MTSDSTHHRRSLGFTPLAYRIEDAAAAIGISRSTLFEYIKDGKIPSRKIGASTVIRHRDLEAILDAAPFSAATEAARSAAKCDRAGWMYGDPLPSDHCSQHG